MMLYLIVLLSMLSLIVLVDGLKINKRIASGKSWKFFDKFTFMSPKNDNGRFTFDIYHNNDNTDTLFLLGYAYRSMTSFVKDIKDNNDIIHQKCSNLISKASYIQSISSLSTKSQLNTNTNDKVSSYKYVDKINEIVTEDTLLSSSASIVMWVIASCTLNPPSTNIYPQGSIDVYVNGHCYNLDATSDSNKRAAKEISYEAMNMPSITVIFFIGHIILVLAMTFVRRLLYQQGKDHYTVKLLHASAIGYLCRYFFCMIYWLEYDKRGKPNNGMLITSEAFFILSDTAMIVFFMLLSGGWTIVRRKMKMIGRIRITFFASAYLMLSIISEIWKDVTSDGEILNFYSTPAGLLRIMLLVVAAIRIWGAIQNTVTNHPTQKKFYLEFRTLALVYCLRLPVIALVLIGSSEISATAIYASVDCVVVFICQIILVIIFHPHIFPENFPFHAKLDDMKLYKLEKKRAEESKKKASDVNDLDQQSQKDEPQIISFTSGYSNNEFIQEDGRVKPPSLFDRLQLSKLKDVVKAFGARIVALTEHHKKMEDVLNAVSVEYQPVGGVDDDIEGEGKRSARDGGDRHYSRDRYAGSDSRPYSRDSDSDNEDNNTIKKTRSSRKTSSSGKQFTPKVLPPTSRNPYSSVTSDKGDGNLFSALDQAISNR